jgi:DNA-binding transcriptional ArsR family regulator
LLASAECLCGELCEQLPLAQSTVSQHLKILKAAGLIRGTISHPRVCYCANPERLREFAGLLDELRGHELRKSGASPVCIPGPSRPGARGAPRKR